MYKFKVESQIQRESFLCCLGFICHFHKRFIKFFLKKLLNRSPFYSFNNPNQTTTAGFEKAL